MSAHRVALDSRIAHWQDALRLRHAMRMPQLGRAARCKVVACTSSKWVQANVLQLICRPSPGNEKRGYVIGDDGRTCSEQALAHVDCALAEHIVVMLQQPVGPGGGASPLTQRLIQHFPERLMFLYAYAASSAAAGDGETSSSSSSSAAADDGWQDPSCPEAGVTTSAASPPARHSRALMARRLLPSGPSPSWKRAARMLDGLQRWQEEQEADRRRAANAESSPDAEASWADVGDVQALVAEAVLSKARRMEMAPPPRAPAEDGQGNSVAAQARSKEDEAGDEGKEKEEEQQQEKEPFDASCELQIGTGSEATVLFMMPDGDGYIAFGAFEHNSLEEEEEQRSDGNLLEARRPDAQGDSTSSSSSSSSEDIRPQGGCIVMPGSSRLSMAGRRAASLRTGGSGAQRRRKGALPAARPGIQVWRWDYELGPGGCMYEVAYDTKHQSRCITLHLEAPGRPGIEAFVHRLATQSGWARRTRLHCAQAAQPARPPRTPLQRSISESLVSMLSETALGEELRPLQLPPCSQLLQEAQSGLADMEQALRGPLRRYAAAQVEAAAEAAGNAMPFLDDSGDAEGHRAEAESETSGDELQHKQQQLHLDACVARDALAWWRSWCYTCAVSQNGATTEARAVVFVVPQTVLEQVHCQTLSEHCA